MIKLILDICKGNAHFDELNELELDKDKLDTVVRFIETQKYERLLSFIRTTMENLGASDRHLQERDELITELNRNRKHSRDELAHAQKNITYLSTQIEKEETFIKKLEVERDSEGAVSAKVADQKISEHQQEIDFLEKKISKQKKMLRVDFPELDALEEKLMSIEEKNQTLLTDTLGEAKALNVTETKAREMLSAVVNNGFYTTITTENWNMILSDDRTASKAVLKKSFEKLADGTGQALKDEACYFSPLQMKNLVGEAQGGSGISFLNDEVKDELSNIFKSLIPSVVEEEKAFFNSLCQLALEDGTLSRDEIQDIVLMGQEISLDENSTLEILNAQCLNYQKKNLQENMKSLMELALSDGEVHQSEKQQILRIKDELEKDLDAEFGKKALGDGGHQDINLSLDDEVFFVKLCKMAMADGELSGEERSILNQFASKKAFDANRIKALVAQAKSSN